MMAITTRRRPASPAPASAVDEGGNLRESGPRTSGELQSVIGWRMLKRPRAAGGFGWQLGQGAEDLDPKIQQRLMSFWEHRLAKGMEQVAESRKELEGFGWWFACKKFPEDWSIKQLVIVLDKFRAINPDFAIVERLAELAAAYPFEAVHCSGDNFRGRPGRMGHTRLE